MIFIFAFIVSNADFPAISSIGFCKYSVFLKLMPLDNSDTLYYQPNNPFPNHTQLYSTPVCVYNNSHHQF